MSEFATRNERVTKQVTVVSKQVTVVSKALCAVSLVSRAYFLICEVCRSIKDSKKIY